MRRYCAHLGYMFTEQPLERRFPAARAAGFDLVEHPSPYALPADRIAELCRENELGFVQMALPGGDRAKGEKGIACLPGREAEFRAGVATGLRYARAVGSRFVHVMSGVRPAGASNASLWATYIANLRFACEAARVEGMGVLVEPIGEATILGYLIDRPDTALAAMDEAGAPNLSMLFDAFHATNAGIDAVGFLRAHHARISHIHIADHPGRHEPGTGTFDFDALFAALDDTGYAGVVGLEYIPIGETQAGLGWRQGFPVKDRPSTTTS